MIYQFSHIVAYYRHRMKMSEDFIDDNIKLGYFNLARVAILSLTRHIEEMNHYKRLSLD